MWIFHLSILDFALAPGVCRVDLSQHSPGKDFIFSIPLLLPCNLRGHFSICPLRVEAEYFHYFHARAGNQAFAGQERGLLYCFF